MAGIKRQRRVIAVGLMRTEASVQGLLSSFLHRRRKPKLLEVPVKNCVLIRIHEAGASLHVELRIRFLDRLQLACGIDCDVPGTWLLTNLFMRRLNTVDPERNSHVQFGTLFEDASDVRKDSLLNLSVRHDVDRLELVVLVKSLRDFRKVFARERFTAGENQDAQVAP